MAAAATRIAISQPHLSLLPSRARSAARRSSSRSGPSRGISGPASEKIAIGKWPRLNLRHSCIRKNRLPRSRSLWERATDQDPENFDRGVARAKAPFELELFPPAEAGGFHRTLA